MSTAVIGTIPIGWTRRESLTLIQWKPSIQWKRTRINPFTDAKDCVTLITFSSPTESNAWINWWFS